MNRIGHVFFALFLVIALVGCSQSETKVSSETTEATVEPTAETVVDPKTLMDQSWQNVLNEVNSVISDTTFTDISGNKLVVNGDGTLSLNDAVFDYTIWSIEGNSISLDGEGDKGECSVQISNNEENTLVAVFIFYGTDNSGDFLMLEDMMSDKTSTVNLLELSQTSTNDLYEQVVGTWVNEEKELALEIKPDHTFTVGDFSYTIDSIDITQTSIYFSDSESEGQNNMFYVDLVDDTLEVKFFDLETWMTEHEYVKVVKQ